jgi:phosphate acyltransferase
MMLKTADVIVTDGFTGNVVLKTLEGGMKVFIAALIEAFNADPANADHVAGLMPALAPLYTQMVPETYGGAVLLGVDGLCIISHGSSNATAIHNAIRVAHELATNGLVAHLREAVSGSAA